MCSVQIWLSQAATCDFFNMSSTNFGTTLRNFPVSDGTISIIRSIISVSMQFVLVLLDSDVICLRA